MRAIPSLRLPSRAARWWLPVQVGTLYWLSAIVGLLLSRTSDGIAALWPANGVLLAALLLAPRRRRDCILACFAASIASNAIGGSDWMLAIVFSAANAVTAIGALALIGRWGSGADAFRSLRGTAIFLAAVTVAAAGGATIGAAAIAITGGGFGDAWIGWASSDVLGMVLVCSLALTSSAQWRGRTLRLPTLPPAAAMRPLLLVAVVGILVFCQSTLPLLFLPLASVIVATYVMGLTGAVAGVAIVAIIGSAFLAFGHGPLALIAGATANRIAFFQFYLAILYGTCLPLATMLTERERLAHERGEADRRYRRILEQSREVICETDVDGRWTYLNPAWQDLTGQDPVAALGTSFLGLIAHEDRGVVIDKLAALYRGEVAECVQELRFRHVDGSLRWALVRSRLLVDATGAVVGTYGNIHDVTDRKAAADAQEESEHRYKLLADN